MPQRSASHLLGSPPRRRGKAKERNVQLNLTRITPAWAGKSKYRTQKSGEAGDHPRVGGEKRGIVRCLSVLCGSPPRGRGKVCMYPASFQFFGITPAWAGKSHPATPTTSGGRDHPRVGGEKGVPAAAGRWAAGSPPRGRGKVWSVCRCRWRKRITPAWAGKS